ncbi:MAG: hypothetical protein ACREMZ_09195 [Gemmatimonadales bacterium]
MPFPRLSFSLACALLVACGSDSPAPKTPDTFAVFPHLPLPPSAQFVSRAGSEDALQITLLSAATPDQVTRYYRDVLSKGRWQLISDVKRPDGSIVLYAEQDGPPIWVRIWPTSDGAGTMVELAGAVAKQADSVAVNRSSSTTPPQVAR